jgi:hypothetical protein
MIDALNKSVEARAQETEKQDNKKSFDNLPESTYNTKVIEIKQWIPMTKDVWINKRDGAGRVVRDDSGKIAKELHKNLTFYNVDITLEITDGEQKGRRIWTSLTTHPNAEFITQGFLFAIGATKMTYGDIPSQCVDKLLAVETFNEPYTKVIVDADTGIEQEITKYSTRVRKFLRPSQATIIAGEVDI